MRNLTMTSCSCDESYECCNSLVTAAILTQKQLATIAADDAVWLQQQMTKYDYNNTVTSAPVVGNSPPALLPMMYT